MAHIVALDAFTVAKILLEASVAPRPRMLTVHFYDGNAYSAVTAYYPRHLVPEVLARRFSRLPTVAMVAVGSVDPGRDMRNAAVAWYRAPDLLAEHAGETCVLEYWRDDCYDVMRDAVKTLHVKYPLFTRNPPRLYERLKVLTGVLR